MRMKMPDHNIGSSSSGYAGGNGGNYSDSYDSDPDGYITPPNEDISGGPNYDEDFSEYMWMENEEEFDKQEMQRLEEEALMEQCIEAMLQDEIDAQEQQQDGQPKEDATERFEPFFSKVLDNFLLTSFFHKLQCQGTLQRTVHAAGH